MPRIFISYRRADSLKDSGRIYDRMVQTFGKRNVFKDIDDIPSGSDFRKVIMTEMSRCEVVLVIIGRGWLNVVDEEGSRRLDNPADFVRIEVETALRRQDISVIPVLVDNARMPRESELPVTLRELAFKNAAVVRDDPDFHRDVTRLIEGLKGAQTLIHPRPKTARQFGWIGLVILLLAVAGMIFLPGILEDNGQQATQEVTEVSEAATETQAPTATPTLTEREKALKRAEEGVSSNDEWTPYSEEINGVEMVLVPKGCFMMGSEEGEEDEKPVHEQCFDEPFWIDRTEVTRAMYEECVEAGACEARTSNQYSENSDQPINTVNWFEAWDYCEWREARLPTEREWEYTARGPDSLIYPWGNGVVPVNVVYTGGQTADVGSRPGGASWVGALDMSGNVWEWVSSLYESYPYTDERESNINSNSLRVLRGGSFDDASDFLRAANRNRNGSDNGNLDIGVRCARSS